MNQYQTFLLLAIIAGVSWAVFTKRWNGLNVVQQDKLKKLGDVALGYTLSGLFGGVVLFMVMVAVKNS